MPKCPCDDCGDGPSCGWSHDCDAYNDYGVYMDKWRDQEGLLSPLEMLKKLSKHYELKITHAKGVWEIYTTDAAGQTIMFGPRSDIVDVIYRAMTLFDTK